MRQLLLELLKMMDDEMKVCYSLSVDYLHIDGYVDRRLRIKTGVSMYRRTRAEVGKKRSLECVFFSPPIAVGFRTVLFFRQKFLRFAHDWDTSLALTYRVLIGDARVRFVR